MPSTFLRTLRSLESARLGWELFAYAIGSALAIGWLAWALFARVPIHAFTSSGRIEVAMAVRAVQSQENGEVVASRLAPGAWVALGDTLVQLESRMQRATLAGLLARRSAEERRRGALVELVHALDAKVALADRIERSDTAEAAAHAARSRAPLSARHRGLTDAARRLEARESLAALDATRADLEVAIEQARLAVERRVVRAPTSGKVVRIAEVGPGALLALGDTVAWIAPPGRFTIIAEYARREAVGIVHPGQRAHVRPLSPWSTVAGDWVARVENVSPEPRSARVRVELVLAARDAPWLEQGRPVVVAIETDRVSPLGLLLRAAGRTRTLRGR